MITKERIKIDKDVYMNLKIFFQFLFVNVIREKMIWNLMSNTYHICKTGNLKGMGAKKT